MRFLNLPLVLTVVALAGLLYRVSYDSRSLDHRIAALETSIGDERDAIAVARAEWSLLNRPERIERLAAKYLQLAPARAEQVVTFETMAKPADVVQQQQISAPAVRPTIKPIRAAIR